jgi:SAM-dependent methyltransferase
MLYAPMIYGPKGFAKDSFKLDGQEFLDVGCGFRKLPGSMGIDANPDAKADIRHDLEVFPWPVPDNRFDLVLLSHVLEHLTHTEKTLKEIHRVGKPGGRVVIQIPYFRSPDAYSDPTHKHFFTIGSDPFIVIRGFKGVGFWIGWPHPSKNPLKEAFKRYIHANPAVYENHLSLLAPAECLTWELEIIK